MKKIFSFLLLILLIASGRAQTAPGLGTANSFGLLSGGTISATDTIKVIGNAGATTIISSYIKATTKYTGGTTVSSALTDLGTAKSFCTAQTGTSISGTLGTQTLSAGVYSISGNATLYDTLTFTGDTNAVFIFNITGNFNSDSVGKMNMAGILPSKIYWNIGGTLTIGSGSNVSGTFMPAGNISFAGISTGALTLLSQGNISLAGPQQIGHPTDYGYRLASHQKMNLRDESLSCTNPLPPCNLVSNPSFETVDYCPDDGYLYHACEWGAYEDWHHAVEFTNGADIFAACNDLIGINDYGVANNIFGSQAAHTGDNYAGFAAYIHFPLLPGFGSASAFNWFVKDLGTNLTPGVPYYVEYYISLSDNSSKTAPLEILAANSFVDILNATTDAESIFTTSTITSTSAWTKISGCFTPVSPNLHAIVMKFSTDPPTYTTVTPAHLPGYMWPVAYPPDEYAFYYVDDMSVRQIADAGTDQTVCSSATLGSSCTTLAGATYSWAVTGPASVSFSSTTVAQPVVTFSTAGTYTFTLTTIYGGCTATDQAIIISTIPVVSAVASPSTICSGTSSVLTASGATSYLWTGGPATSTYNVSPTTTTTYTVTGTTGSCSATATTTVTVRPLPSITSLVPNSSICNGQSHSAISFTSSPTGAAFNWTNSDASIGLAASGGGSIPSFTGINTGTSPVTATITVTPTLSHCSGSPITFTITVNPTPNVSGVPSSRTVCPGTSIGATSFSSLVAGTTYHWTNSNTAIGLAASGSGNVPVFTAANSTGSPISGIITVTPTAGFCSGSASNYTITVNPAPVASVSPTAVSIISGAGTTLTASGGTSYSWAPAAGLSSTSIANPTASPTSTTTYTVTATNSYGCSATATSTVTVTFPECGVTLDYDLPDGTHSGAYFGAGVVISNKNIRVNGVFTVDRAITFSSCNFIMAASGTTNGKIDITNGTQLTLNEKTHLYSCGDNMWDGIYVESGSILDMTGYVFTEDALNAVVSIGGGYYQIESCIFNRNLIGVDVRAYASAHPGYIRNTVFTSRSIPSNTAASANYTVGDVKTLLSTFPAMNLKSPNSGFEGVYGVNATSVSSLTIGYDALLSISSSTSFSALNVYDNIMCGINLTQTNATIYNSQFQNMLNPTVCFFPGPPCYSVSGYGINATGTTSGTYTVTVGGTANIYQKNTFNNIYRAIQVTDYKTTSIVKNSFTNSVSTASPTVGYGNMGIYVKPASSNSITITDNAPIKNCATAIWIDRAYTSAASTNLLQIDNNGTVTDPISADAGGFCSNGIYITDLSATPTVVPTLWEINGNVITETNNCIFLQNVKRPTAATSNSLYTIMSNSCKVRYASTGSLSGIEAKGCAGLAITLNHTKYNTPATGGTNLTAYGIYLENSSNMLVKCNLIDDAARGLTFYGTCSSTLQLTTAPFVGITQNTITNGYDGFVLKTSGIIGTQGSSTVASNNYWGAAAAFTNSQTYTDGTSGANTGSKLYMNSGGTTFPTLNLTNVFDQYTATGGGLNPSSGSPSSCGTPPALIVHQSGTRDLLSIDSTYVNDLINIVKDTTTSDIYNEASHWQRKNYVYNEIKNNNDLISYAVLDSFYNANSVTAFGQLANVSDAIAEGSYMSASSLNSNKLPANMIEQNQQTINSLLLTALIDSNYVYTTADSTTLNLIAYQCPVAGGNAVYQARNLLMTITNNVIEFTDSCKESPKRFLNIIKPAYDKSNELFKIYPNPNNGNMTLEYSINSTDVAMMKLVDITGKELGTYSMSANTDKLQINNSKLNNGIYFYQIIVNNKIVKHDKLIIIK